MAARINDESQIPAKIIRAIPNDAYNSDVKNLISFTNLSHDYNYKFIVGRTLS